tara:strand:- start:147 stop:3881 length:3735 start_codon:yes stop_codon:yes gene_type:complete
MTMSEHGGGSLSDKIYNGTVKAVKKGQHGKRRVILSIIGIGDAFIGWNKTPRGVPFPVGAKIQARMAKHNDGRWLVTEIVTINGKSPKPHSNNQKRRKKQQKKKPGFVQKASSSAKKTINRLLKGPTGYMRKMYLYAMGGSNIDLAKLESRAESLAPFIEYVELAKKSHAHLKKRARFVWEVVEDQKRIEITERFGVNIRVRRTILPYVVDDEESSFIKSGSQIIHPKTKQIAEILRVRVTDDGVEFATDQDLTIDEGWKFFDENMNTFSWSHNRSVRPISSIVHGDKELTIKDQKPTAEWFNLILDSECEIDDSSNLLIDGQRMEWEIVPGSEIFGPLKDGKTGRQVVSRVRAGDSIALDFLPTDDYLYDSYGIRHGWKDVTKSTSDVTLKIELEPEAAALIDDEKDVNPLDVLFSPDTEYRELNVTGHDDDGNHVAGGKIKVYSKREQKEIEIKMTTIRIKGRDIERQTITVDRVPPNENAILTLTPNVKYLERQRDMLLMLRDQPLAHHDRLLRLTERGNFNEREELWSDFEPQDITDWKVLVEKNDGTLNDGTEEQRMFVKRALSTPDFAILQGPPGSGKTTAIIELITQCALQNKRVLLCGSTQASIDNVLTRIIAKDQLARLISPLRIGWKRGIYDEGVHHLVLSEQIDQYIELGLTEEEAQDLILRQSNLTCGTMQGILQHPWIAGEASRNSGRLLRDPQPEWDVLIIDEASKTTFQQFIIPAAFAKKWILVGDVHQLSPFLESSELMTNLDQMKDEDGNPFTPASQRACLLIRQLIEYANPPKHSNRKGVRSGSPILMIEPSEVPSSFVAEINAQNTEPLNQLQVTLVGSNPIKSDWENCRYYAPSQVKSDTEANMFMLSSDIIMCGSDCYEQVAEIMPPHAIVRNGRFEAAEVTINRSEQYGSKGQFTGRHAMSSESLNHDWSHEITWRLNRAYELKAGNETALKKWESQIDSLLPKSQNVKKRIEEVRSIALPSVLECLQYGFASKDARELLPETTLTQGFPDNAKSHRFQQISYQHRMHPEISRFSREEFYNDTALIDANTISDRDTNYPFEYRKNRPRSIWLDVPSGLFGGVNKKEVGAVRTILEEFIAWARDNPPTDPRRDDTERWEVALLSPYQAQRRGLRDMVRQVTGMPFETRFDLKQMSNPSPIMLVVNSSDRFQGQEADVVFLSLRNGQRIGFLDSPSRMNVAATRPREWRIIVGNHSYFSTCPDPMLKKLAISHRSSIETPKRRK